MKELKNIIYSFDEWVKAMHGLENLINTKELINQLIETSEEMKNRLDAVYEDKLEI